MQNINNFMIIHIHTHTQVHIALNMQPYVWFIHPKCAKYYVYNYTMNWRPCFCWNHRALYTREQVKNNTDTHEGGTRVTSTAETLGGRTFNRVSTQQPLQSPKTSPHLCSLKYLCSQTNTFIQSYTKSLSCIHMFPHCLC